MSFVPNWLRIILLILSFLSFLPQFQRILSRQNDKGISVCYVLFNLISATEQFALTFFMCVNMTFETSPRDDTLFVHNPVTAGDYLNLIQTAVAALSWLVFFVLLFYFPSHNRGAARMSAAVVYIAFLCISVIPLAADALSPPPPEDSRPPHGERPWFRAIWHGVHTLFLSWIITGLGIAAVFYQLRQESGHEALSRAGLKFQAVLFALVAVSWVLRVQFPYAEFRKHYVSWWMVESWYELVGWTAVDNAVFALGQAVLLAVVVRRGKVDEESDGERQALLAGE